MKIRSYQSKDCTEIIELFYNTVHFVNSKDYNDRQINVWAPKNISKIKWDKSLLEHYSVVVEENGIIIGFGDLGSYGYFDRLYVHKDYQGIGVGKTILNEIEKYAYENGVKVIVTHASITAKSFFYKFGYKVIKEQSVERYGESLNNFVMEKTL
ncbi:GNAT family N-acetyltransferase [Clostridium sp.]|uniref:GNAT family N-acetyltransferase n=1 Tax=Clostridium sp. TaxID=1506 RepID=UPI002FCA6FFC